MLHIVPKSEEPDEGEKPNPYSGIEEVPRWRRWMEVIAQVLGLVATATTIINALMGLVPH